MEISLTAEAIEDIYLNGITYEGNISKICEDFSNREKEGVKRW